MFDRPYSDPAVLELLVRIQRAERRATLADVMLNVAIAAVAVNLAITIAWTVLDVHSATPNAVASVAVGLIILASVTRRSSTSALAEAVDFHRDAWRRGELPGPPPPDPKALRAMTRRGRLTYVWLLLLLFGCTFLLFSYPVWQVALSAIPCAAAAAAAVWLTMRRIGPAAVSMEVVWENPDLPAGDGDPPGTAR